MIRKIRDHFVESLLILVAICLVILIISPYLLGYKIKNDYESLLVMVSNQSDLKLEVISFDAGWFTTQSNLAIRDPNGKLLAYFRHRMIHGPLYLGLLLDARAPWVNMLIEGDVIPAKGVQSHYASIFDNQSPISLTIALRFNGDAVITVDLPAVTKTLQTNRLQFSGATIHADYRASDQHMIGEAELKQLLLHGHDLFEVHGATISFDQLVNKQAWLVGDMVVSMSSFKSRVRNEQFDWHQFTTRIVGDISETNRNYHITVNSGKVYIANEQLNSLALGVKMTGVNNVRAKVIDDLYKQREEQGMVDGATYSTHLYKILWAKLKPNIMASTQVSIEPMMFYTDQGHFEGLIQLEPNTVKQIESDQTMLINSNSVVELSVTSAVFKKMLDIIWDKLDLSTTTARRVMTDGLRSGFIKRSGDNYLINLVNHDGKLKINNRSISASDIVEILHLRSDKQTLH